MAATAIVPAGKARTPRARGGMTKKRTSDWMLLIAVIRLLDEALPSGVWLPYLVLGVLFVVAGALVFRKRNVPSP